MIKLQTAGQTLIDGAGMPRLGVFDGEFESLNICDTALRVGGLPLPKFLVSMRVKEWFHAGIITPTAYIGAAIIDTKIAGASFVSYINRDGTGAFDYSKKGAPGRARVPKDMLESKGDFTATGYHVGVVTGLRAGVHEFRIRVDGRGGNPSVDADLRGFEDPGKVAAMVVSMPVGGSRTAYSHKCVIRCEGSLKVNGVELMGGGPSYMLVDYHKALYPRHTFWKWATFAGAGPDGLPMGFNLTKNCVADDWEFNENCLWEGGRMHLLGPAAFEFDHDDVMKPWIIKSMDGAADLVFTPNGIKCESMNAVIMKTSFKQAYGLFNGTITAGGRKFAVSNLFGMCEDHDSYW
ncbi:MAG: DUF2804 domain-containing protein [Myxococcota bacterium]